MKQNDKYLAEGLDILNREFGQPLPTLEDTMKAHQLKKEGGPGSGRPKDDTRGNPDDAWDDEEGRAIPSEPDWDIEDDEEAKRQAMADMGLDDDDMFESFLKENPAAVAAATQAMVQMKAKNPKTGRVNKMTTALSNKSHPQHKKAKGIFAKIVDKFKKKKDEPKKQSKADQYKAMMQKTKDDAHYKKQFTGESITEGPSDVKDAKKALSMVVKQEQKFRKQMFALEQVFLQDPTKGNDKLAKDIKKSYKDGVTKFMRDSVLMVKRMK
jgi:hypothetical protein